MEIGAYIAINNLNLKIPEDISLIGFDNLPLVNIVNPPLSFSEQPTDEMGLTAAKLLYRRMLGDQSDYPKTLIHRPTLSITQTAISFPSGIKKEFASRKRTLSLSFDYFLLIFL